MPFNQTPREGYRSANSPDDDVEGHGGPIPRNAHRG